MGIVRPPRLLSLAINRATRAHILPRLQWPRSIPTRNQQPSGTHQAAALFSYSMEIDVENQRIYRIFYSFDYCSTFNCPIHHHQLDAWRPSYELGHRTPALLQLNPLCPSEIVLLPEFECHGVGQVHCKWICSVASSPHQLVGLMTINPRRVIKCTPS